MDVHSVSKRFSISPLRPFVPFFFLSLSVLFEFSLNRDIRLYPASSTTVQTYVSGRTGARGYSSSLKRFLYPLLHIPSFLSYHFFPPESEISSNVHTCV